MSKTKKIISLALTLLMVLNIFSVVAFADDLADYTALTSYIEKNVPTDNDAGIYSTESYAPVAAILDAIDYELSASEQSTVDGYLSELQTAVAGLVADESQAVAEFALSATDAALHPEDEVDVTLSLETNYRVISAGVVIIYDSTKFELVGGTTINSTTIDYSSGVLADYTLTGSNTNTAKIFAQRNSNTSYWNTNEMKAQYTALNLGFALNSKISDPVIADGDVATITFRVLDEVQFGTSGSIFISSDFNKTSSFAGGLNYASRSVGEKMGPVSSCITVGQTIDLTGASVTLAVDHTLLTTPAVDATCTEAGSTAETTCSVCGAVIAAGETIPALGHNYEAVVTGATCLDGGYTTYTCSRCGDTYTGDATEALGHNYEAVVTGATCLDGGYTTYTCSRCGDTYTGDATEALGHDYEATVTEPTCTEGGYTTYTCSRCGDTYTGDETAATGHNTDVEWVVVTPATCTATGLKTKTCPACGTVIDSEEIAMTEHAWDDGAVTTAPTCTQTGVKTYTCSVCGATKTEDVAIVDHTAGEAAVENIDGVDKYVVRCTVCGEIISVSDIGLADYTALNAALAVAAEISETEAYNVSTYNAMVAYIENIDMNLNAAHQDDVDAYTAAVNAYLDGLTVADQLRVTNGTASIDGTNITLTVNEGQTQINVLPTLVCGDRITFSNNDGPKLSKSGTCYSTVNGTVTITLADERQFTVEFAIKDPSLDHADYTAVEAALAKAAAIKEEDVYDAATYTALAAAVDAVVFGLREKDQSTVNGYATAINNAYKNVATIQKLIRVSGNTQIEKNGDTIVLSLKVGSTQNYLTIYNNLYNETDVTFLDTGKLTPVSDNIRFVIKQNTAAKVLLENGKTYNLLFIITPLEATGYDALEATVAKADALVADDYYDFSKVTAALEQIDWKLDETEDIDTINYYSVALTDAMDSLQTIASLIKLAGAYASKDGDTITARIIPGQTVISMYITLTNGDPITLENLEGMTLNKDGKRYTTKIGGTSTMTLKDGRTYNMIYTTEFVKEFRPDLVKHKLTNSGYTYNAETGVYAISTTNTIARLYKDALTCDITVDASAYAYITETATYYQINSALVPKSANGIATFEASADDGTDFTVNVLFTCLKTKTVLDYVTFYNGSEISLDGTTIYITLDRTQTTKTYIQIPKVTATGEQVIVASDNTTYVQNQNNDADKYTLRYQAAGSDITLTFDGVEYTLVYTVIAPT